MGTDKRVVPWNREYSHLVFSCKRMKVLVLLTTLVVAISALGLGELPQEKDLLCDICQDIVTYLADFLTSDPTEAQITEWVKAICHSLGEILNRPDLETTCNLILTAEIPAIIDQIVEQNLDPATVCTNLGACTSL